MPELTEHAQFAARHGIEPDDLEAIVGRQPFESTWLIGYYTAGGTYMLASPGRTTDSGEARDLAVVLPAPLEHGRVVPVWVAVSPTIIAGLNKLFDSTD